MATPEERYGSVTEALLRDPDVARSEKRGFGSSGLWVAGKVFVMLVKDELVVKLPRPRVDALVAAGQGARFEPGPGRVMKEWLTVPVTSPADWLTLAREAREFVASRGASPGQASTAVS
jgi:hypothetical protein